MTREAITPIRRKGISADGETAPLFPPLHVNEAGKSNVRAPPRNKMALYEQFTVPYSVFLPSKETGCRKQYGPNELHFSFVSYDMPHTLPVVDNANHEAHTRPNPSHALSNDSLSTCTAVVNLENLQKNLLADDMSPPNSGLCLDKSKASCGKILERKPENARKRSCTGLPPRIAENLQQEVSTLATGSQLLGHESGDNGCDAMQSMQLEQLTHWNAIRASEGCHSSLGSVGLGKAALRLSANDAKTCNQSAYCDEMESSTLYLCPVDVIKPKDVIHAIGQQLFWKARRAILRQQQVFSNQVFELHKLIEVQKLLAIMPSTLLEERECIGTGPNTGGSENPHFNGDIDKQKNIADAKAIVHSLDKGGVQLPHGSNSRPRVEPSKQVQREGLQKNLLSQKPNSNLGQSYFPYSFDGVSAWGYPLGPMNRPLVYSSADRNLPPGAAFGGVYGSPVVGQIQPMAPLTFPCYTPRPDPASAAGSNNQWHPAVYHSPFLGPMMNDWFTTCQNPLPFGSGLAVPTNSVPSINMKAEASAHTTQSSCKQQALRTSRCFPATRSLVSQVTTCVSTPLHASSRKVHPGSVDAGPISWKGEGGLGGESKVKRGGSKDGHLIQARDGERQDEMDVDVVVGANALNLFPLQPSSSSACNGEDKFSRQARRGRLIKAIPHPALAASESAAGILLSLQRERQH